MRSDYALPTIQSVPIFGTHRNKKWKNRYKEFATANHLNPQVRCDSGLLKETYRNTTEMVPKKGSSDCCPDMLG